MMKPGHRSADPGFLVGDDVLTEEQLKRLLKLMQDNPHLTATQLLEVLTNHPPNEKPVLKQYCARNNIASNHEFASMA